MATFNSGQQNNPGQRTDGLSSALFGVMMGNEMVAEFTEASGLEAEVDIFEYQEGGNNLFTHKLPGRVKFPKVILKRGVAAGTDLWDWFQSVMYLRKGEDQNGKSTVSISRRNISLVLYDQHGNAKRTWNLMGAYPTKWTGPSFKASDNAISIESIELVHNGLELKK